MKDNSLKQRCLALRYVYRFVAFSLFLCCPIILYIIFVCYSCVDGTEIKDTNSCFLVLSP